MNITADTTVLGASVSAPARRGGFHLTQRGRLLFFGLPSLLMVVALLSMVFFASASLINQAQASEDSGAGVQAVQVTVAPGDTLWSVAAEAAAEKDVHQVMAQIAELNGLHSSDLQPGEVLYVPAQ